MIIIEFCFPTGKLHATPWGRQVNEGAVEWPPSPWRILRALIAVRHLKFPEISDNDMQAIIDALAAQPQYSLPPVSHGHTRHYMPTSGTPAKVFDTFIVVAKKVPVIAVWPDSDLSVTHQTILRQLLQAMTYLGRAESWVEADLATELKRPLNTIPVNIHHQSHDDVPAGYEIEQVLSVQAAGEFEHWRSKQIEIQKTTKLQQKIDAAESRNQATDKVKLSGSDVKKIEQSIPIAIPKALECETSMLRKEGWNRPPGSQWVDYVRPSLTNTASATNQTQPNAPLPTVARFAVAGKVVPQLTAAVRIGDRVHRTIMGCSRKANELRGLGSQAASVFSGKDQEGNHLKAGHQHAHYLPESIGSNGKVTHVNVVARQGFDPHDEAALSRFNRTWGDEGHDLQFVLVGVGQPSDFSGFNEKAGQSALLATSRTWVSRTPFLLSRHMKFRAADKINGQPSAEATQRELVANVLFELSQRPQFAPLIDATTVHLQSKESSGTYLGSSKTSWLKFHRTRPNSHGKRSSQQGYGFRIEFPEPVCGPVALGYGSHFGLGQFVAVQDASA